MITQCTRMGLNHIHTSKLSPTGVNGNYIPVTSTTECTSDEM